MRNAKQETIADIVADIRAQNQGLPEDSYALSPLVCDLLSFADRIEAAAKREREAGAEAAQVCGEIGEMIGREATREKSSRVSNAAKMREEAHQELNRGKVRTAEMLRQAADDKERMEAVVKHLEKYKGTKEPDYCCADCIEDIAKEVGFSFASGDGGAE